MGGSSKTDKKRLSEDRGILNTLQTRTADASMDGSHGCVVGWSGAAQRGAMRWERTRGGGFPRVAAARLLRRHFATRARRVAGGNAVPVAY